MVCGTPRTLSVRVKEVAPFTNSLGTGLIFKNNGADNLTYASGALAGGTFYPTQNFTVGVVQGALYNITVSTNPSAPNQVCSAITTGSGTMPASNLTVDFACSTSFFTVSASVTGLAGTGLKLRNNNNGADELTPIANGTSSFTVTVAAGMPYSVTVSQNPTNLSQTCAVTGGGNGTGGGTITSNVTVTVTCTTNPFVVSGTVSGLPVAGNSVTLQLNGGNNKTVTNPATTFNFPAIADGSAYSVTVLSKTAGLGCYVTSGSGTIAGANVTNVTVTCGQCISGGNKQITVTWNASRSFDVNNATGGGHKIYYDTSTGVSNTTPNVVNVPNTTSTTTGTITGVWSGCTYFIKVGGYSSINSAGGNLSPEKSITVP